MSKDSVRKRFIVTLFVNIFKLIVGIVNTTIVPRSLGVVDYGNYQFLIRSFTSIRGFFTLGTTSAFFTYSSKNVKSGNAFLLFFGWTVIQIIIIFGVIFICEIFQYNSILFPDQITYYIVIIAVLEWINFFSTNLIQFGESKAETVYVQKINFISNFIKLGFTVAFYILGMLDLNTFIIINYLGSLLIIVYILLYFIRGKKKVRYFEEIQIGGLKKALKYFLNYCTPLIIYEVFGFLSNYFDRWLLQLTAGSVQQAYFSIGYQWATITMLFTTSVGNIFWREISFSFGQKEFGRISEIYFTTSKALFFLSVFLCFVLVFQADNLVELFINEEFSDSVVIIQIMAFYPVFMTINTLNTNYFYGTEKIRLYRNISVFGMIFNIISSYFLIAPSDLIIPGLGLQAKGVAISYIINVIISTYIQTIFIIKALKGKFVSLFLFQIVSIISLGFISYSVFVLLNYLPVSIYTNLVGFFLAYSLLVCIAVYIRPQLIGLNREKFNEIRNNIITKVNSIIK